MVTYRVSTGGKLKYTYNFEVDLAQKTVVGKNPDAMSLLNSGKPMAAKLKQIRQTLEAGIPSTSGTSCHLLPAKFCRTVLIRFNKPRKQPMWEV